ncbi:MAG: cbb3-type cytochrome oxidase assembly protein CcoS [Caldimonas sp.]
MDILFLLVPFSVLLVFGVMGLFAWALQTRQFEDLEREGERIFEADELPLDRDQPPG